nr:MAG TPA: hypothetical protein [Caudoviricetes sp.]
MVVIQSLLRQFYDLLPRILLRFLVVLEVEHRFLGAVLLVSSRTVFALRVLSIFGFLLLRGFFLLLRLGLVAVAVGFWRILEFAQIHVVVVVVNNNFGFVLVHGVLLYLAMVGQFNGYGRPSVYAFNRTIRRNTA